MAHFQTKVSSIVSNKPIRLWAVILTPESATVGDITVYNGRDSLGENLGTYRTGSGITLPIIFACPFLCDRGLYLSVGSNVTSVLLIWEYVAE